MTQHRGWFSRGYLPHFDSPEIVQFVTFRLADCLPKAVLEALRSDPDKIRQIDSKLDGGLGVCWLKQPEIAALVQNALLHFDGERYRMLCWCVMPNHVHTVLELLQGHQLGSVMHSWKSYTATRANALLGRSGAFWHDDYFDRFMRGEDHLTRTICYVEQNPVKAGLVAKAEDWLWGSARLRHTS